jgi:hypothetical protein
MTRLLAAGLALLALAAWLRRPHVPPPPSRPFPLNGRSSSMRERVQRANPTITSPVYRALKEGRPHLEGRHTDGSCAFCDWLDETPVPGYRRSGAL